MTLNDAPLNICGLYYYDYRYEENSSLKISFKKTQYAYRFLYVDRGHLDVRINEKSDRVSSGDIIFLLPGDTYQLLPCENDFSLYSLSFNFDVNVKQKGHGGCVFMSEYNSELCSPRSDLTDATCFNKSSVFKQINCKDLFANLRSANSAMPLYEYYRVAQLRSILCEILRSVYETKNMSSTVADKIIEYIYSNYNKDISAKLISQKFSYHPNYINKLIKQKTSKSLSEFIRNVKIEHAIGLMCENDASPSDIYSLLGYYDYSHFYKSFVAQTGLSPTEYKKRYYL